MEEPRIVKIRSWGCSSAARFKVPTSSRPIQFRAAFEVEVICGISTVQSSSVQPYPSGGANRFRGGGPARFRPVFGPDDLAHEFDRESGVVVGKFDPDGFTLQHRQLVAKLVADVTPVADLTHGPREVPVVFVGLARDHAVDPVDTGEAAVRVTIKFPAEMRHHLHGTD